MIKILQLYRDNAKREKAVTNMVRNGDDATIYVYDVIDSYWGVSALSVINQIAQAGDAKTLHIRINSPGGDVFESRAIMAAISAFAGKTIAHIDSLCASAATSVALACGEIEMSDGAFFMIHNAQSVAFGDKTDLRNRADLMEKIEGAIVNDYTSKTGKDAAEIIAMMDAETWLTAAEAVTAGFVDRIAAIAAKPANTWNVSAYANAPAVLVAPPVAPVSTPATPSMSQSNANRLALELIS